MGVSAAFAFALGSFVMLSCNSTVPPSTGAPDVQRSQDSGSPVSASEAEGHPQDFTIEIPHAAADAALVLRIRDESGAVNGVRLATDAERRGPFPYPKQFAITTVGGGDRTILAAWSGTICDKTATMHIDVDIAEIRLMQGPRKTCDSVGTSWAVVLSFGTKVVPGVVRLQLRKSQGGAVITMAAVADVATSLDGSAARRTLPFRRPASRRRSRRRGSPAAARAARPLA